jgi:acetoin utilization deacetylase AcuC-like enzyme
LNDQAIASNWLLKNTAVKRILIIDLDVHQGNGTAQIFAHEKAVFTFSMHGQSNYPLQKEQSDLDVGLHDNCGDDYYLSKLTKHLAAIQALFVPDFIFYQCGVDVLAADKLGKLVLSLAGCAQPTNSFFRLRNRWIVQSFAQWGEVTRLKSAQLLKHTRILFAALKNISKKTKKNTEEFFYRLSLCRIILNKQ